MTAIPTPTRERFNLGQLLVMNYQGRRVFRRLPVYVATVVGFGRDRQFVWVTLRGARGRRRFLADFWQPLPDAGVCRECGCTDDDCRQCVRRTGRPCSWAEANLCSACAGEREGACLLGASRNR
jgi:hypothetical protein